MAEDNLIETLHPDEVFALLADETRITILQALWETDGQEASFSTLRDGLSVRLFNTDK